MHVTPIILMWMSCRLLFDATSVNKYYQLIDKFFYLIVINEFISIKKQENAKMNIVVGFRLMPLNGGRFR